MPTDIPGVVWVVLLGVSGMLVWLLKEEWGRIRKRLHKLESKVAGILMVLRIKDEDKDE